MTKTYHMRLSLISNEEEATSIAPSRSDVIFTRERFSEDVPLRPLAIRQVMKTFLCSESRLSSHVPVLGPVVFDRSNSRRSAFLQKATSNENASPRYCLPMKRRPNRDVDPQQVLQRNRTQYDPSTPDTMMSPLESIQCTPMSYHSQNLDFSPPSLYYQSPNFLVDHEKAVPQNILLPSL